MIDLVDIARRALADEPRPIGAISPQAAIAEARIAALVAEMTRPGGTEVRTRARARLAALAAVGLEVLGVDTPISSGPRLRAPMPRCPTCGALPGARCTRRDGVFLALAKPHEARKRAAKARR